MPSLLLRQPIGSLSGITINRTWTTPHSARSSRRKRALADNYNNVPRGSNPDQYTANSAAAVTLTDDTGNAGDRIGCGVIK